ncbi:hypothetical protein BS47DRAFT_1128438 [Hydnum rufescens UP504]|uniref:Sec20 C-terminal domain-containing protein n=1 Tax=Hydnum rufescens UP504 TaxID=1448309 RepID=A0A9P6DSB8_9AGAM|nr:hypothetical protein BS47DRAFT_1128438 [Hydnum rufescens UP504]
MPHQQGSHVVAPFPQAEAIKVGQLRSQPPMDSLFEEAKGKLAQLDKRLNDAQSFQIPRLRDHTGSLPLQQRYGGELRDDIESCRRELQILEAFVDDIVRENDRKVIYDELDILISKVEQLKKAYRSALLTSKRAIDAQVRSHRDELMQSSAISSTPEPSRNKGPGTSEDALMNANAAVTDTLRRTTQLMHQEIERSVLSTQMLEESTRTLSMTSDLYTMFGSLMDTSKTLVTALEKSDWLDRLLILSSLAFFLLVVAYILKKRIIDKGIWLAFWWIKYLPLGKLTAGSAPRSLLPSQPQVTLRSTAVMKPVPLWTQSLLLH